MYINIDNIFTLFLYLLNPTKYKPPDFIVQDTVCYLQNTVMVVREDKFPTICRYKRVKVAMDAFHSGVSVALAVKYLLYSDWYAFFRTFCRWTLEAYSGFCHTNVWWPVLKEKLQEWRLQEAKAVADPLLLLEPIVKCFRLALQNGLVWSLLDEFHLNRPSDVDLRPVYGQLNTNHLTLVR